MKKLILGFLLLIIIIPAYASEYKYKWDTCEPVRYYDSETVMRCENSEVICYIFHYRELKASAGGISCKFK
jgi:hypothetical protein